MTEWREEDMEVLRVQVAERLGWTAIGINVVGCLVGHPPERRDFHVVPSFSKDIKAAWEIVDMLTHTGTRVAISHRTALGSPQQYVVEIGEGEGLLARESHSTASAAVCLAFLKITDPRAPKIQLKLQSSLLLEIWRRYMRQQTTKLNVGK